MNFAIKYFFIVGLTLAFELCFSASLSAQPGPFTDINVHISPSQFVTLKSENNEKYILQNPTVLINGDTAHVKEIHARGNNSMKFQRKSLSVELEKSITIKISKQEVKLKKFNLISLSMDKNLWHNRLANLLLEPSGLFPLINTFCTVTINGDSQGIYLLVEKPQHYQSTFGSPYMLRRGIDHKITDEYFDKDDLEAARQFRKQYQSIYSTINKKQPDVINELKQSMDLPLYFRWIAFNYLFMNGDYSDEVYFIINPDTHLFEIIPWDFDDLLRYAPHEGNAKRKLSNTDKKIFSLEDKLDFAIASKPDLYLEYELELKKFLLKIDSSFLTEQCNRVLEELKLISSNNTVANASLFLDHQPFDYNSAKGDILISLDLILKRRKWILQEIK